MPAPIVVPPICSITMPAFSPDFAFENGPPSITSAILMPGPAYDSSAKTPSAAVASASGSCGR